MKQTVLTILRTGVTRSKKSLSEFVEYCDLLKYLLTEDKDGRVILRENYFWKHPNMARRDEFIRLLANTRKRDISDHYYYQILNTLANGDKFGIDTFGEW